MFNYNHLYYFYMTAKLGGVMKASKALRVAQPALSSQIKILESQLKRKLFTKSGRRLALTPEGQRALIYCQRAFEATADFEDYLKHSERNVRVRLRIGVSPEIERPFLSDALSTLLRDKRTKEEPLLISMRSGNSDLLLEKLRANELDAAVTGRPLYGTDLKTLTELQMPVIAVCTPEIARDFAINTSDPCALQLKRNPSLGLILPSDVLRLRIESDHYLQRAKIRNSIVFESDILAAVVRAALDGIGVAFLPLPYIRSEIKKEMLTPIGLASPLWKHAIYFTASAASTNIMPIKILSSHFAAIAQEGKMTRQ